MPMKGGVDTLQVLLITSVLERFVPMEFFYPQFSSCYSNANYVEIIGNITTVCDYLEGVELPVNISTIYRLFKT